MLRNISRMALVKEITNVCTEKKITDENTRMVFHILQIAEFLKTWFIQIRLAVLAGLHRNLNLCHLQF